MAEPLPSFPLDVDPPTQRRPPVALPPVTAPPKKRGGRKGPRMAAAPAPAAAAKSPKSGGKRGKRRRPVSKRLAPYKAALLRLRKNPKDASAMAELRAIRAARSSARKTSSSVSSKPRRGSGKRSGGKRKAVTKAEQKAAKGVVAAEKALSKAKSKAIDASKASGKGAISAFYGRHETLINAGIVVASAASVNKIDAIIPYRPLGESVPPSAMALGAAVGGALLAKKYKKPKLKKALVSVSVGLGAGLLTRAITKRSLASGSVSGTEDDAPEV